MGSLFIYFTALAILISILGLFGLVQFTSSRRAREIGIRKVLGGGLSKDRPDAAERLSYNDRHSLPFRPSCILVL
jgi:hypothetical protein